MSFWAKLDIEPTTNVTSIRQAYAAKLKITRPDVDAEAYQALQEAYQQALKHAKSAVHTSFHEASPEIDGSDNTTNTVISKANQILAFGSNVLFGPDDLVAFILDHHLRGGEDALITLWPNLENKLHQIPLHQLDEYIVELVEMVVGSPKLPPFFINQLRIHFNGGNDFRLERIVGGSLARQLLERLKDVEFELRVEARAKELNQERDTQHAIAVKKAADNRRDFIMQRDAHLQSFVRFSEVAKQYSLNICAFLVGPKLLHQWQQLDAEQREILQIDEKSIPVINGILQRAAHIRTRLIWLLVVLAVLVQLVINNNFDLVKIPFLLMALLVTYYFQAANLLEKIRQQVYPTRLMNILFTQRVQTIGNSRAESFVCCLMAFSLSCVETPVIGKDGAPFPIQYVVFICFLMLNAFLTKPLPHKTAHKISPAIFALCLYIADGLELHRALQLLTLSAFLNSAAYATQLPAGEKTLRLVWLASIPIALLHGSEGLLVWLSFGLSWFLYDFAKRQSVGYSTGLIAFALVSFPALEVKLFPLWICIIAAFWFLICVVVQRYAHRMTQINQFSNT
jgi:hypothetical protein